MNIFATSAWVFPSAHAQHSSKLTMMSHGEKTVSKGSHTCSTFLFLSPLPSVTRAWNSLQSDDQLVSVWPRESVLWRTRIPLSLESFSVFLTVTIWANADLLTATVPLCSQVMCSRFEGCDCCRTRLNKSHSWFLPESSVFVSISSSQTRSYLRQSIWINDSVSTSWSSNTSVSRSVFSLKVHQWLKLVHLLTSTHSAQYCF